MTDQPPLYPLLFEPVIKQYVWGGRKLMYLFGRNLPTGPVAESWEIAGHQKGTTAVANGPFQGWPLTRLHQQLGLDLIGRHNSWAQKRGKFPLLIKLLDAQQSLSVQVHPDDAYAKAHEGNELGKTEVWVVLHAEPGAAVILGVKGGTDPREFRTAAEEGQLERYLHRIPVKQGDVVFVPAGSLHAILSGLVIAEIQQNSDVTYRVYDWNRRDPNRPLHLDQAIDVINFAQVAPTLTSPRLLAEAPGLRRLELCRSEYFVLERIEIAAGSQFQGRCDGSTLEIWGALEGEVVVQGGDGKVNLTSLGFTLLPAALGDYSVSASAPANLLRVYAPGPDSAESSSGAG